MKSDFRAFIFAAALGFFCARAEEIVQAGSGSYRLTKPQPCKALPEKAHVTANVKGAAPTHQWWSSLLWQEKKFGQPLFAHPLAATCSESGLSVSYPGSSVRGDKAGIFGAGAGKDGDLKIGHSGAATFSQVDCDGFSDWFVSALFVNGEASMRVTIGHGSPFVYCIYAGGNPVVSFSKEPQVWSGKDGDAVIGVTSAGRHYGLFGANGSKWSGTAGKVFSSEAQGKNYFSVALLPDNKPETLALFKKYAHNHVTDSKVEYKIDSGFVKSTYRYATKPYEGNETGTIFALYPHQWKYASTKLSQMTYGSIRGTMKVGVGETFATEVPIQGVLPYLPAPQNDDEKAQLLKYVNEEKAKISSNYADTYWEGKLLGRFATLSGVAEAAGSKDEQKVFVDAIKKRLENWFTAAAGKEKTTFYYNAAWHSLIGSPPSYGSDMPLNDHHFHYGYFVRAAAEVARLDPDWAAKWGPMVKLVIREIASPDRNDSMFPHMRCFDKYAGHSWASGDANFADGNNQESSSESLNAWYGMALWGAATGDAEIRDAGLFLFNTERTAVEEYWFDVSGTNYPKDTPNVALGMIWGGKGAFATWFSADIDCIHGINWLPFTPASIYMGRHPDYVKKNYDRIVEKRKGKEDFNTGWGDLVLMFGALENPERAAKAVGSIHKLEGGNSRAFMNHWVQTLNDFGRNDSGVTADYPFFNVYRKNGANTYAVYNFSDKPIAVKFSDGKVVKAEKGMTVQK